MFKKLMKKIFWYGGVGAFTVIGVFGPIYILGTTKKETPEWRRGVLAGMWFGASAIGYVRCGEKANEIELR